LKKIKFYMEHGPRGMQPIALEVDEQGKPIKRVYANFSQETLYFEALTMRRHMAGSLVAELQIYEKVSPGWIRITEKQARAIDSALNYGSMERITGLFFGQFSDEMSRNFGYQQWEEYLDPGMQPNQFRVLAREVRTGNHVAIQYHEQKQGEFRTKRAKGMVVNISSRVIMFTLQNGISSRMYGDREYVTVYKEQ